MLSRFRKRTACKRSRVFGARPNRSGPRTGHDVREGAPCDAKRPVSAKPKDVSAGRVNALPETAAENVARRRLADTASARRVQKDARPSAGRGKRADEKRHPRAGAEPYVRQGYARISKRARTGARTSTSPHLPAGARGCKCRRPMPCRWQRGRCSKARRPARRTKRGRTTPLNSACRR